MPELNQAIAGLPDMKISVRQVFGIDSDLEVPAYSEPDEHVPARTGRAVRTGARCPPQGGAHGRTICLRFGRRTHRRWRPINLVCLTSA